MNSSNTSIVEKKIDEKLSDNYSRTIDYLRLSITDRCNLRCNYCMPFGVSKLLPQNNILSYNQALRIIKIFIELGVSKVRITGGEPFVRRGFIEFLHSAIELIQSGSLHITTNGVFIADYISELISSKIDGINISLDTLDKKKFIEITGFAQLEKVLTGIELLIKHNIQPKINTVVLKGVNDSEICAIAELAKDNPIEVRFIEKMPFSGKADDNKQYMRYNEILQILQGDFPSLVKLDDDSSTSSKYTIPGFKGTIGIIGGYSRLFCDNCNRIRVTSTGYLRTCLYEVGKLNLKNLIESNYNDAHIKKLIKDAVLRRYKNGVIAESEQYDKQNYSMSTIGG